MKAAVTSPITSSACPVLGGPHLPSVIGLLPFHLCTGSCSLSPWKTLPAVSPFTSLLGHSHRYTNRLLCLMLRNPLSTPIPTVFPCDPPSEGIVHTRDRHSPFCLFCLDAVPARLWKLSSCVPRAFPLASPLSGLTCIPQRHLLPEVMHLLVVFPPRCCFSSAQNNPGGMAHRRRLESLSGDGVASRSLPASHVA